MGKKSEEYYNNLIGQKFGMLEIKKFLGFQQESPNRKDKIAIVECLCKCGNIKSRRFKNIKSSIKMYKNTSCGCISKLLRSDNAEKLFTGVGDLSGNFYTHIKCCAKKRNIEFEVSKEYLWNLFINQNKKCYFSGINLLMCKSTSQRKRNKDLHTASLDRLNSKIGYLENNVVWVHKDVNFMKQDYTQERFLELANKIVETQKEKLFKGE